MLILFILQFQFRASQIFEILVHPRKHVKNRFLKRSIPVVKFENTFRQDSFIPLSDFIIQFRISRPFLRFLSSLSILSSIRSASRFSILLPAQFFPLPPRPVQTDWSSTPRIKKNGRLNNKEEITLLRQRTSSFHRFFVFCSNDVFMKTQSSFNSKSSRVQRRIREWILNYYCSSTSRRTNWNYYNVRSISSFI